MSHPSYAHFYPGYVPQAAMSSHSVRPQIGFSPTGIAYPGQIPLCDTVIEKMKPLLVAMQEHTSKQLQTVHTEIQALSQATRDARDNTNAGVDALTKLLDKSHKANARQANQIIGHLTGLRDIIGNPAPGVANSSVLDRLAAIEFTVGELLERAKDPEAPKPEIVYHEVGTSPMRQHEPLVKEYADVAVDVESLPSTPIPAPLRNESLSLLHRSNRVQSSIAVQGCVFHSDSPFPNLIDAESQSPDQSIYSPESLVPADWTAVATTPRFAGPLSRAGSPASYSKAYMEKFGTPGEQQGAFSEGTVAALRRAALEHALASPDMTPVVTDPPDPIQMPTTPDAPSMVLPSPPATTPSETEKTRTPERDSPVHDIASPVISVSLSQDEEDVALALTVDASVLSSPPQELSPLLSPLSSIDEDEFPSWPGLQVDMKPTPSFQGSVGSDERSGTWVSRVISTEPSSRASSSRASRALSAPQAASSSLKIVVKPRGRKRKSEFSQTPSASASGSAPPAKRPRGRPRKSAVKIESAAVGLASHHHREEQASCEWPKKPDLSHSFDRQFIQCDNCELWYHYGCVAIGRGDPRLKGGVVFICPPCNVETAKRVTQRKRDDSCARPGCDTLVEEEYIIERILGRKAIGQAGFVWLAKWDGYALSQATWIPEGNIGDEGRLFEHFFADAKSEGIDIDGADPAEVILLEEAREGGLGS